MSNQELPLEKRFRFGKNWLSFLASLQEAQIEEAQQGLASFLGRDTLEGTSFLDIGSGSGIHSLAARRFGAKVRSFDFDPDAVICTQELKKRYHRDDVDWIIEQGSVLDRRFMQSLGVYDICYSWGVLHHTGALWQALYNAQLTVKPGGLLFIGIYNDEGIKSALWKAVKRTYNAGPVGQALMTFIFYPTFFMAGLLIDLVRLRSPARRYREHKKYRGMSLLHDWKDWLGGYPFEPANPQELIGFIENMGFDLERFSPTGHGFGNNQFLFCKKLGI
jgi:2-polyprenyl-3-methyl-5-hydroxy-6-metoxy-1,4-benzoquinol methylase